MTTIDIADLGTPTSQLISLAMCGDPAAKQYGLHVATRVDRTARLLFIGLDDAAAEALTVMLDDAPAHHADDPYERGRSHHDVDLMDSFAHALSKQLTQLTGYVGRTPTGQFRTDPQTHAIGLFTAVGSCPHTDRTAVVLDVDAAHPLHLITQDALAASSDEATPQVRAIAAALSAAVGELLGSLT